MKRNLMNELTEGVETLTEQKDLEVVGNIFETKLDVPQETL